MVKHNNEVPNQHFHKVCQQDHIRTWFNQPARKQRRRAARQAKAAKMAPRPMAGLLRPVVHPSTIKYNYKLRQGRGFTFAELKQKLPGAVDWTNRMIKAKTDKEFFLGIYLKAAETTRRDPTKIIVFLRPIGDGEQRFTHMCNLPAEPGTQEIFYRWIAFRGEDYAAGTDAIGRAVRTAPPPAKKCRHEHGEFKDPKGECKCTCHKYSCGTCKKYFFK